MLRSGGKKTRLIVAAPTAANPQRSDPPDPCIGDVPPHGVRDHPRPRHRAEHHADLARIEASVPQQQGEEGRRQRRRSRSARRARGRRFSRGSPASCARHVNPGTSRAAFSRYTLRSTVSGVQPRDRPSSLRWDLLGRVREVLVVGLEETVVDRVHLGARWEEVGPEAHAVRVREHQSRVARGWRPSCASRAAMSMLKFG